MRANRDFRKDAILAAIVVATASVAVAMIAFRGDHDQPIAPKSLAVNRAAEANSAPRDAQPILQSPIPPSQPRIASVARPAPKATTVAVQVESPKRPVKKTKPDANGTVADDRPLARQALDLVGFDVYAEAVWVNAINDPSVSAHDRQDLIEDLNENGFDDPGHVTADDLPLIESRIALIEDLAPFAMDDVNAAAFAEAYKDLVNMHAKAMAD
jgi:hypothetical protein